MGDKFIAHYNVGLNQSGVGGFVACSLHFFSNRQAGHGANWHVIAAPRDTIVDGISLFDSFYKIFGSEFYYSNF